MSDSPIGIDLKPEKINEFNQNMQNLYYSNRPEYEECLLRCKILNLVNDIWQTHLYENELDLMQDEYNKRYRDIITEDTFVELESIPNPRHYNKPYKKYSQSPSDDNISKKPSASSEETKELKDDEESESGNGTDTKSRDKDDLLTSGSEEKSNYNKSMSSMTPKMNDNTDDDDEQFNHWCTPIEGEKKVIIIREYEGGPVVKRVTIPSVMIFGSIAFGLDGFGSDIDLALPASISSFVFIFHTMHTCTIYCYTITYTILCVYSCIDTINYVKYLLHSQITMRIFFVSLIVILALKFRKNSL